MSLEEYLKKAKYCTNDNNSFCFTSSYDYTYDDSDWFINAIDEAWEADQRWRSEAFW